MEILSQLLLLRSVVESHEGKAEVKTTGGGKTDPSTLPYNEKQVVCLFSLIHLENKKCILFEIVIDSWHPRLFMIIYDDTSKMANRKLHFGIFSFLFRNALYFIIISKICYLFIYFLSK